MNCRGSGESVRYSAKPCRSILFGTLAGCRVSVFFEAQRDTFCTFVCCPACFESSYPRYIFFITDPSPPPRPVCRREFCFIGRYLVYVEGHCAACRYGFMMRLGSVILKVRVTRCLWDVSCCSVLYPAAHKNRVRHDAMRGMLCSGEISQSC